MEAEDCRTRQNIFEGITTAITRETFLCKSITASRQLEKALVLPGHNIFDVIIYVYQCSIYILACQGINVLSLFDSGTLSITTSFFRSTAI